jgi:hypothetical protein
MHAAVVRFTVNERWALLALGLAVWGGSALLGGPALGAYRDRIGLERKLAQYDSLLVEAGDHALLREQLGTTNVALKAKMEELSGGMARAADLSGLLETLIGKAKRSGIPFVSVKPQGEGTATHRQVLLEFSAPYSAAGAFVAALESQPHLSRVDRLAVNAGQSQSVEAKLLVTVYFRDGEAGQ